MIIETIVSTVNEDGSTNLAPMGALPESEDWDRFELRPFSGSSTGENLKRSGEGVLHLTDDVLLFARAIAGEWNDWPGLEACREVHAERIAAAQQAFEFRVVWSSENGGRASLHCQTLARHRGGLFRGMNRARAAVIEAAVLVSRLDWIPRAEIVRQLDLLGVIVERTGGPDEVMAFGLLNARVRMEAPK